MARGLLLPADMRNTQDIEAISLAHLTNVTGGCHKHCGGGGGGGGTTIINNNNCGGGRCGGGGGGGGFDVTVATGGAAAQSMQVG